MPHSCSEDSRACDAIVLMVNDISIDDADGEGGLRTKFGRYVIDRRLGAGGMGVVYQAEDPDLGRTVAIKILHRDLSDRDRERLQREAIALARLSHPNVVQVYEIGRFEDRMFIAMEFVRGRTFDRWHDRGRGWRECVRVYAQAARGLAAAHAAGLVHRDFKPSNCILGDDGRVRVLDFGLALEADRRTRSTATGVDEERSTLASLPSVSKSRLTVTGSVVGTLGYMAPEQFSGKIIDAASDQFSFCVSLYEALYGERPYLGGSAATLTASMLLGILRSGGTERRIPRTLRQIVVRGLHLDVEQRWPSMDALTSELSKLLEPWRRRTSVLLGVGVLAGLGGGVLAMMGNDDAPCTDPEAALGDAWDAGDRERLRESFGRLRPLGGADLHRRVEGVLDAYAENWMALHEQSCRATFVDRSRSTRSFEHQMLCLERRRSRLRAASDELLDAVSREQLVHRAIAPFRLPSIDSCSGADLDVERGLPPGDESERRRLAGLRQEIEEVVTIHDIGDYGRGLELSDEALARVEGLGPQTLLAEILEIRGRLLLGAKREGEAGAAFERAIRVGAASKNDRAVAAAWSLLIFAKAQQDELDEGLLLELPARAAADRLGDDIIRSWLLNSLGYLYSKRDEHEAALEFLRSSQELKISALGPDHVDVGISWLNLGNALMGTPSNEQAEQSFTRAREIFSATIGPAHPLSHYAAKGLGRVLLAQGKAAAAVEALDAARSNFDSAPSEWVADVSFSLARAQWLAGSQDDALRLARQVQAEIGSETELAMKVDDWLSDPDAYEQRMRAKPTGSAPTGEP